MSGHSRTKSLNKGNGTALYRKWTFLINCNNTTGTDTQDRHSHSQNAIQCNISIYIYP